MKTIKNYIWMAAIALTVATLTACSNDDFAANETPMQKSNIVTLTATLSPKEGDGITRALTENGNKIEASWAVDEEVCVKYTDAGDNFVDAKGIVTAVDGNGKATITVDLINPKDGNTDIFFHYPYNIGKGIKDLNTDQIGTLPDIAANFDDFDGDGTLNVTGGVATLPTDVIMTRNVSIWKLAFKVGESDITNTITALNINISGGATEYDVTPNALDAIYVALGDVSNTNVTITAATPSGNYSFSKDDVTLTPGKFYRSSVTLTAAAASSTYREYSDRTTFSNVAIPGGATTVTSEMTSWAAGTYVVSSNVTIAGNVLLTGDVKLILKDGAELTVNGCLYGGTNNDNALIYKLNIYGQELSTGKLNVHYDAATAVRGVVKTKELNIHGGIVTVEGTGVRSGINPEVFNVYHGTVNVEGKANGIIPSGDTHIYGGTITAHSSIYEGGAGPAFGVMTDGKTFTISGGTVDVRSDNSSGLYSWYRMDITGGTIYAQGKDDGICAYKNFTISGGTITAIATDNYGAKGIYANDNFTINGGTITAGVSNGGRGVVARYFTINDGKISAEAKGGNAGIYIFNNITINGGEVTAVGDGSEKGIYSSTLEVNGGFVTATGGPSGIGLGCNEPYMPSITLTLNNGVKLYEGDSPNPSVEAASQSQCTKRYAIIR